MAKNNHIESVNSPLNGIEKKTPFSVPADYFEHNPNVILDRISQGTIEKKQVFLFSPGLAIAASILLIAGLFWFYIFNANELDVQEFSLNDEEIQLIIDNPELYGINEFLVNEKYLSSVESYNPLENLSTYSDDEVKSYLETNTDANYIIYEY